MDVRRCLRPSFQFSRTGMDRSSTKSVELNRQSFRNEIGGDRVSIVVSHIYYYLSVVCQVATILLRRESRQVLRTFIFCKTSSIFVDDLDDTIEARKRASHKEINRWQESRCTCTHKDRSNGWTAIVEELRFSPTHHRSF